MTIFALGQGEGGRGGGGEATFWGGSICLGTIPNIVFVILWSSVKEYQILIKVLQFKID